jgi:hypothetical protein
MHTWLANVEREDAAAEENRPLDRQPDFGRRVGGRNVLHNSLAFPAVRPTIT